MDPVLIESNNKIIIDNNIIDNIFNNDNSLIIDYSNNGNNKDSPFIDIVDNSHIINNKTSNNIEIIINDSNNNCLNNNEYKTKTMKYLLVLNIISPIILYYIYKSLLDNIDENTKEIKIITHIFRSMWSLSLFFVLTTLNVYIWDLFNIDYKSIFKLKEYSIYLNNNSISNNTSNIFLFLFKRSLILFSILIISLMVNKSYNNSNNNNFNIILYNIPLLILIWSIFFSVIFYDHFLRNILVNSLILIIKSPFKSISFLSFWIADQITSLSIFLKDFNITLCFLLSFLNIDLCFSHFKWISPIILSLPFIFRISQCIRVYYDTNNTLQLFNAYKYFIGLVVLFFSNLYHHFSDTPEFKYYWIFFATTGTFYSYYWDVVRDWGLFEVDNKSNYLLRDQLLYSYKPFYYYSIISNLIMRFNWLVLISPISFGFQSNNEFILGTFLISIDIIRRCQWNYLRMEYEQIIITTNNNK